MLIYLCLVLQKKSLSQRTSLWGWQPWRVTPPNLLKRKHNAPGTSQENAVRPESHFVRRTAVKSLPPASVNTIPHKRSWKDSLVGIFSLQRGWRRLGPSFPPPAKEEIKVDNVCAPPATGRISRWLYHLSECLGYKSNPWASFYLKY